MPRLQTYKERPVVLLTNDDGPPCASSPNIFAFCKLLQSRLGWDVRVVIPDCQKSWVGKAYAISDVITASYFYPLEPDGLKGEITTTPRPLKEGETMEWVLLSSTPASCTNIALHNLYPGEIDLVISGPNHGRNSSTAFALSSGTLGAALAGALSVPVPGPSSPSSSSSAVSLHEDHMPCIAVSYGVVTRPVSDKTQDLATEAAVEVCAKLFNDWGYDHDHVLGRHLVQIYSVNIPLVEDALVRAERKTCWTNMWRNTYGGLFKATKLEVAPIDRASVAMLARPSDPSLNWWSNAPRPAPAPSSAQELTTDRPTFSCAHPSSSASCSSSQPSMRDQPSLASLEDSLNSVTQNKAKLPDHTPSIPPPGDAHSPLLLNFRDLLRTHARDQDDKTLSNATNNSCVVPQTLSNPINAPSHRSSSDARYDPGDLSTQPHAAASARTDIWDQGKPSSSAGQSSNRSQPNEVQKTSIPPHLSQTSTAGPGALPTPNPSSPTSPLVNAGVEGQVQDKQLKFHFAPNMKPLLAPPLESLPVGSDAWAFAKGYISVTPIRAQFAGPVDEGYGFGSEEAERKAPGAMW